VLFRRFGNRYVVRIDKPFLHLHVALADTSFRGFGGHLQSAVVSGTCEVLVEVLEGYLKREFNEKIGLKTIARAFPAACCGVSEHNNR
jgi:predicted DNA-binding protein with PD1-like motif